MTILCYFLYFYSNDFPEIPFCSNSRVLLSLSVPDCFDGLFFFFFFFAMMLISLNIARKKHFFTLQQDSILNYTTTELLRAL